MNRRTLLLRSVQVGGLAVAGIVLAPAVITAMSPALQRRPDELWRAIGVLDDFPVGQVTKAFVELPADDMSHLPQLKGVYVRRVSVEHLVVYSRNCTDLSCPVTWDEGSGWFYCPCHGGIFDQEGEPVAGPPSRPLYRYAVRVRDDVVQIDLMSLPPIN